MVGLTASEGTFHAGDVIPTFGACVHGSELSTQGTVNRFILLEFVGSDKGVSAVRGGDVIDHVGSFS